MKTSHWFIPSQFENKLCTVRELPKSTVATLFLTLMFSTLYNPSPPLTMAAISKKPTRGTTSINGKLSWVRIIAIDFKKTDFFKIRLLWTSQKKIVFWERHIFRSWLLNHNNFKSHLDVTPFIFIGIATIYDMSVYIWVFTLQNTSNL